MSYQNTVDSTNAHLAESDKHSVNSSSHRDPDTQAANISAYTMSVPVASIPSRMDIEALAQPSQTLSTAQSEGKTQAKDSKLVEEQRICVILDRILDCMHRVDEHMRNLQTYIRLQKEQNKPLYQWDKYDGYRLLEQTVSTLNKAMLGLRNVPREHFRLGLVDVTIHLDHAARSSTAVSNAAVYVLGTIGQKSATCMDEIVQSPLSDGAKDDARTLILDEARKLLKHTTGATDRMYAAMDLIRSTMRIDYPIEQQSACRAKKPILGLEVKQCALGGRTWAWTLARVLLSAATSAAIGLAVAHLYGPAGFTFTAKQSGAGNDFYGQMINIVEHTRALANTTSGLHWVKIQDIDQRYRELEIMSEAHGLRIDNLVESLGPPNAKGTYFVSSQPDGQIPIDVQSLVWKMSDDLNRQTKQLQTEMEQMRKEMLRTDIRLTNRLEKVSRGK